MVLGKGFILFGALAFAFGLLPAQNLVNGSLDGPIATSVAPTSWAQVPYGFALSQSTSTSSSTSDITGTTGPVFGNISGNPYHGNTYVSGLHARSGGSIWHEGIQQTVNGFTIGVTYQISFFQMVSKQSNATDNTGSWGVIKDNVLLGISTPSLDNAPVGSNSHVWDRRTINFVATAASHTLRFLPFDDDALIDIPNGIRMGIDSITLFQVVLSSPVQFEVALNAQQGVDISWEDMHAHEVRSYFIERSASSSDFEPLAELSPNLQQAYQFTDQHPYSVTHYRIGSLSYDGELAYSEVQSIQTQAPIRARVVQRELFLSGGSGPGYTVELTDVQGRILYSGTVSHSLHLDGMSPGLYLLRVASGESGAQTLQQKILLSE